ncbi:het-E-1 heterokaryon incompatibility protein [Fusarium mexicanum]|uniref:Het-E-1 heterokaryon incompatibility protein n=1 Tax=Fusarium mexicanum TaxID=751941 RepID=A0A8H5J4S3_9HYPO|nr:het-E-1 heterokaryon incompatibility protein [Fusarium mexicanum]
MPNSTCLWTKARENLPVDVKEWLASLEQGIQPSATATEQIDTLIEQTTKKQKDLEKSNHRFRRYFDKIINWLDKVKGIGDVISSFDPVHAALPWAAFRFALQAILAEREQAESVLELLASTPHFVFSGRVLEMVYTTESMRIGATPDDVKLSQQCLNSLHEELIKLYSGLLSALNSSEVVSIHKELEVQHKKVIACGENCHKILSHTLSRKSLDLVEKIQPSLTDLGDRFRELLVRIDESERRKTLGTISSILFRAHHDEISQKRTAGTCEWILKRETFVRWKQSDSSVTILYGNPGAGKTFLISRVVDYTIEGAKAGEALAFFYCKRDEENRRNPQHILRSILRQLSTPLQEIERGTIHVALKDLPTRLELNGTTFDVSTCEQLIGRLIEDYSRTTVVLDALDECDRNTREELMRVLSNLTNGSSKLRVFISSRHDEDILRHFSSTPVMMIQATDNEEDISSFVQDKLFRDTRWVDISSEFQEEVKSVFHEKSQGMFQWAALQVDQIHRLKLWSERSIGEQLNASPIGLKGAYDVVWNQIQEMSPYEEQLARRALQWALCAFKPLKTSDLLLMMQIDPESGTIEADTAFTPETIQSICGNLLVYDREVRRWRFSHLSAREYIEKHHYSILEAHQHVAISSIKFFNIYLVMSIYGVFHVLKDLWQEAGDQLDVCPMLTPSPLTLAVVHGHECIWKFILSANAKVNNGNPGPLIGAIICNNMKAFEAILEAGADVNYIQPRQSRTIPKRSEIALFAKANVKSGPQIATIQCDNMLSFKVDMLKARSKANYSLHYRPLKVRKGCEGPRANTALEAALWFSRKRSQRFLIQILLDRGADFNTEVGNITTLELAVLDRDEETVRALLDANTVVYNPDHFLSLAARNTQYNLIPLFVNLGANIEKPWEGVLPLVLALRWGNLPVVQSLLEMLGTSIDLSCQDDREAIHSAMFKSGGRDVFPFLFGSAHHINWLDCEIDNLVKALELYSRFEYELSGLGLNASNFALGCTEGTANRQLSLVDILLNAGADPSISVNFGSRKTITAAAFHGRLHHVRALLDRETFEVKQKQKAAFRTALLAMMSGHLGTVSRKSIDKQRKPFGHDCVCPRYLEVLLRLFDGDLSVYMPIYDSLTSSIPLLSINRKSLEMNDSRCLHVQGNFECFSRLWLSIMWDLQNSTSPQLPLRSQLRQWQFPGILPLKCFIVTKVTTFSKARSTYFVALSICGNRSHFSLLSAPQRVREPLSHRPENGRWKKYKPEIFGAMRFLDLDDENGSSNTDLQAVCGNFEAHLSSCHRNRFALVLLTVVVGLLSYFLAVVLSARKHR